MKKNIKDDQGKRLFNDWLAKHLRTVNDLQEKHRILKKVIEALHQIHCKLKASSKLEADNLQSIMQYSLMLPGMLEIKDSWSRKDTEAYQAITMGYYREILNASVESHIASIKKYQPLSQAHELSYKQYLLDQKEHVDDVTKVYKNLMQETRSANVPIHCVRLNASMQNSFLLYRRPRHAGMRESLDLSESTASEVLDVVKVNSSLFIKKA